MKNHNIIPGKLYRNKRNYYQYDKILTVISMKWESDRVNDSYIEFVFLKKPDRLFFTTIDVAMQDWEMLKDGELE